MLTLLQLRQRTIMANWLRLRLRFGLRHSMYAYGDATEYGHDINSPTGTTPPRPSPRQTKSKSKTKTLCEQFQLRLSICTCHVSLYSFTTCCCLLPAITFIVSGLACNSRRLYAYGHDQSCVRNVKQRKRSR